MLAIPTAVLPACSCLPTPLLAVPAPAPTHWRPPAPVLVELPAFINSPLLAPDFAVRPVLRVGDYEVGETFCPRLYGHPGIRY